MLCVSEQMFHSGPVIYILTTYALICIHLVNIMPVIFAPLSQHMFLGGEGISLARLVNR